MTRLPLSSMGPIISSLVLVISTKGVHEHGDQFVLNDVYELLSPILTIIPTQFIAYYAALHRNYDIDKPRNLAKSVTVE